MSLRTLIDRINIDVLPPNDAYDYIVNYALLIVARFLSTNKNHGDLNDMELFDAAFDVALKSVYDHMSSGDLLSQKIIDMPHERLCSLELSLLQYTPALTSDSESGVQPHEIEIMFTKTIGDLPITLFNRNIRDFFLGPGREQILDAALTTDPSAIPDVNSSEAAPQEEPIPLAFSSENATPTSVGHAPAFPSEPNPVVPVESTQNHASPKKDSSPVILEQLSTAGNQNNTLPINHPSPANNDTLPHGDIFQNIPKERNQAALSNNTTPNFTT